LGSECRRPSPKGHPSPPWGREGVVGVGVAGDEGGRVGEQGVVRDRPRTVAWRWGGAVGGSLSTFFKNISKYRDLFRPMYTFRKRSLVGKTSFPITMQSIPPGGGPPLSRCRMETVPPPRGQRAIATSVRIESPPTCERHRAGGGGGMAHPPGGKGGGGLWGRGWGGGQEHRRACGCWKCTQKPFTNFIEKKRKFAEYVKIGSDRSFLGRIIFKQFPMWIRCLGRSCMSGR